jgi:hypothetical protein
MGALALVRFVIAECVKPPARKSASTGTGTVTAPATPTHGGGHRALIASTMIIGESAGNTQVDQMFGTEAMGIAPWTSRT